MKPMKIGFFGLFGQKNWGNECTLQAILYNTRMYLPNAIVICICTDPEDTSARYGISAYPMRAVHRKISWGQNNQLMRLLQRIFFHIPKEIMHWVTAFKILKGIHLLVAPGTGLLTDFDGNIFGRPYEIFKWSFIAKMSRCKLLFVSIGAGPIRHPLGRWFIKSALSMADYRSYRNSYSKQYLESIGFETKKDPIYPDLAFSLQKNKISECKNQDKRRPVIGVGVADEIVAVKDYHNAKNIVQQQIEDIYREYMRNTCSFVGWLLDNKYTVRILSGDSLHDINPKEELKNQLKIRGYNIEDGNILDEQITSVEELLAQLATTDVVVSPRFHNIVLALMLEKPVISLSYHEKFVSLMAELGLEDYCQDTDNINYEKLTILFTKLMNNADNVKELIKIKIEENRLALDKQYMAIFNGFLRN
jgi:polysaccharide pyruvyl transferase WcaK-like protein